MPADIGDLWATHAVHHSPNELTLAAAFRIGIFGKVTRTALFFVPRVWLGFDVRDLARAQRPRAVLGYLFMPPGRKPDGEGHTTDDLRRNHLPGAAPARSADRRRTTLAPPDPRCRESRTSTALPKIDGQALAAGCLIAGGAIVTPSIRCGRSAVAMELRTAVRARHCRTCPLRVRFMSVRGRMRNGAAMARAKNDRGASAISVDGASTHH